MRAIQKQATGGFPLNQAHAVPPPTPHDATTRWGSFGHKASVMQCLLDEQYHLCCYSELRADQEELGYHIEHVENKSQNPSRTFDFTNLAASALDSEHGLGLFRARGDEIFGGHAKGKSGASHQVNMTLFISPHRVDCHRFFAYLSDGRIVPTVGLTAPEQDQAQYTIDTLNLNSPFLVTLRRQWWDELDQLFQEHRLKDWSLPHLVAVDLVPTTNGKLSRFFSLTRLFFGAVAEQVLEQQAPALL